MLQRSDTESGLRNALSQKLGAKELEAYVTNWKKTDPAP